MRQKSLIWFFIPVVALVPITFYAASLYVERTFSPLPIIRTIADFSLTNQENQTSTSSELDNKITVVDFFFTHCPTVCRKMTNSLKTVQESFPVEDISIVSISVDPERDSVSRLKWYTEKFALNTANWQLLTGRKQEIYKLARNGFSLVATDGDGGPTDFIHSEQLVLLDTKKRIRGYYNGTNVKDVTKLIQDIKKLKHEQ